MDCTRRSGKFEIALTRYRPMAMVALAAGLVACGDDDVAATIKPVPDPVSVTDAATRCAALAGLSVPSSAFGLAAGGASLSEAVVVPADTTTGAPEYCRVKGAVAAAQSSDPPILFQVNLPSIWNVKMVQFGGGGFNGTVITGTGNVSNASSDAATPLVRGYVTFGGDSGHSGADVSWILNAQALANYAGESVKRTRDVAVALVDAYYAKAPARTYYIGGSKGGHEGLVAAQRYAADYDGVVAYYPANQNQAMVLSWYRMWQAAYEVPGGWLNPAKQTLLRTKVMQACDALDGLTDNIVGNVEACQTAFAVSSLRCADGTDQGDSCLSDTQINTLMTAATPLNFAFPLAFGVTSIGPYPVFNGGDLGVWLDSTGTGTGTSYYGFNDPTIRYVIQQNPAATSVNFDYRPWQARVQEFSAMYDATNPDIDAFKAKGGKLIIVQGTTDMLVTHTTTTAYVDRLSTRYPRQLSDFVRYYVVPGFGHGNGSFNARWDSLSALEAWSEKSQAPVAPVASDNNAATRGRTRPMCEHPAWPKYDGSGDVNLAASYSCVVR